MGVDEAWQRKAPGQRLGAGDGSRREPAALHPDIALVAVGKEDRRQLPVAHARIMPGDSQLRSPPLGLRDLS